MANIASFSAISSASSIKAKDSLKEHVSVQGYAHMANLGRHCYVNELMRVAVSLGSGLMEWWRIGYFYRCVQFISLPIVQISVSSIGGAAVVALI